MRGFDILERIHDGPRSVVLRARRAEDGHVVVLKRPRPARPDHDTRVALEAEHALMASLAHPALVRTEGLVQDGHRPVLVMADAGRSLEALLPNQRFEPEEVLRIGAAVADALAAMHGRGLVHRDVHPGNILLGPDGRATLADLGLAGPADDARSAGDRILGQLRYVAPEQTGRIRGQVDERSDLYALGAVLFELLTGAPPFASVDPAQLVHAHLAQVPPRVADVVPAVPRAISDVVSTLLEKRPEDRYQTAAGLAEDLRRLDDHLEEGADLDGFVPRATDAQRVLHIPDRLYGRDRALAALEEARQRSQDGARILVTIDGDPGAGKSAVIAELARTAAERGHKLLAGRFSEGAEEAPLSGFVQVLRSMVQMVLAMSDEVVSAARIKLRDTLGEDAALLQPLVPELGSLLPGLGAAPDVSREEKADRLTEAMCRLFRRVANPDKPLILVLEDVQAADRASLRLLERLLGDKGLHYALVVLTHRPEIQAPGHPVRAFLEGVDRAMVEHVPIRLDPLSEAEVGHFLQDALPGLDDPDVARILRGLSVGNPFSLVRTLTELAETGVVRFEAGAWRVDRARLHARRPTEDVVELLIERMRRLPEVTQEVLRYASCLGTTIDGVLLAEIAGREVPDIVQALLPAHEARVVRGDLLGRISTCPPACALAGGLERLDVEFTHERFREAAYREASEALRTRAHLAAARALLRRLDETQLEDRLFEVVGHFERGLEELTDPEERETVSDLLFRAGQRATDAASMDRALVLHGQALELLPPDAWTRDYERAMTIALEVQGILLVSRNLVRPASLPGPEVLLSLARVESHRLEALAQLVVFWCRSRRAEEALQAATAALREHGIELMPEDAEGDLRTRWARIQKLLGSRAIGDLLHLPTMQDKLHVALLDLIRASTFAMYLTRRDFYGVASLAATELSIRRGVGPMTPLAFAETAGVLAERLREVESAAEFSAVAVALGDRHGHYRAGSRVIALSTAGILIRPLHDVLSGLREALRVGYQSGETLHRGLGQFFLLSLQFMAGVRLDAQHAEIRARLDEVDRYLGRVGLREATFTQRAIEVWRGERAYPWDLVYDAEREEALAVAEARNPDALAWRNLLRVRLALTFGDVAGARAALHDAAAWNDPLYTRFRIRDAQFLDAATLLAEGTADEAALEALEASARDHAERVDAGVGENARHRRPFLEGVLAWYRGDRFAALTAFEAAIQSAEQQGILHDLALMSELVGGAMDGAGLRHAAEAHLLEARQAYDRWGALAVVTRLDGLLEAHGRGAPSHHHPLHTPASSDTDARRLDLDAVLRAAQALSETVRLEELLQRVLRVIAENAGAQRAVLVLFEGDEGRIVGQCDGVDVDLETVPLNGSTVLPVGVVKYVARTGAAVVMDDAVKEGRFRTEPYMVNHRPVSVLAAPVKRRGETVGVIYLQNDLNPGAFTADRLEMVELLSASAAIALEQAEMYDALEQKVEARTRDLAEKNAALEESLAREQRMQSQLVVVEKMASLGKLVAGVAHELNTPIGAVVSSADTSRRGLDRLERALEGETLDKKVVARVLAVLRQNQKAVQEGGDRVAQIVRTLRTFAHLDEAERQKANLHEGLENTLRIMAHRLEDIEVERDYGALPAVDCFPQELNQVFLNLLTNAVQAVEVGGGKRIRVRTRVEDDHAVVEVEDDGPGIPREVQPQIFDPGFTTRGVGVGLGLGLSICFAIVVDKHRGRIEVDSVPGEGATLRICLPIGA